MRIGWVRESVGGGLDGTGRGGRCWFGWVWILRPPGLSYCEVWVEDSVVAFGAKEGESCFEVAPWYRYPLVLAEGKSRLEFWGVVDWVGSPLLLGQRDRLAVTVVVMRMELADSVFGMRELGFPVWIICACEVKVGGMRLKSVPVGELSENLEMA